MDYFDESTHTMIFTKQRKKIAVMQIIGEIEGHDRISVSVKKTSYDNLFPILSYIEFSDEIDSLIIIIHSTGGDVDCGLAIAEFIAGMSKKTYTFIIGTCHSIAIPIAVSAHKSFVSKSGLMLIHPIRIHGTTIEGSQSFDFIKSLQNRINDFICSHSNISYKDLNQYLYNKNELTQDIGTMLSGEECVSSGLINQIGGIKDVIKYIFD